MAGVRSTTASLIAVLLAVPVVASGQDGGAEGEESPAGTATDGGSAGEGGAGPEGGAGSQDSGSGMVDGGADGGSTAPQQRPIEPERLPRVRVSVGAEQVELGALATLSIDVTYQEGDRVHLKGLRRLGRFEVLERRRQETPEPREGEAEGERPSERIELDLMAFETGELEIPAVELMVVLRDGRTGTVRTDPLQLQVADPLANEHAPEPRGDHAPVQVHTTDRRALWAGGIIAGLLLAALLGLAIERLRARRKPKPATPPPPPRPPEEVALEKLRAAERSGMLEKGKIKAFHIAVSEAVREYFGGRYGFDSLELTSEELLVELDHAVLRGITRKEIVTFLRETDMVKFAKWRPEVDRSQALLKAGYDIVRRTTAAERAAAAATVQEAADVA